MLTNDRGGRQRLTAAGLTVVVAAGLAGLAQSAGLGRGLELETADLRFRLRGEQRPPDRIVLVQVDERALGELGRWPFRRSLHARLIDRLVRDGARTIAIDLQFTERTTDDEDNALVEAIDRADRVVLGTTVVNDQGATNVLGGDDVVADIGARVGSGLFATDPGGVLRRLPYGVAGLESFAVVTAEMSTRRQVAPFDEDRTWIDYAGPPGTLRSYSYADVLAGRVPAERLRGEIVVVGTSAPRLKDVSPTSTTDGTLMSGPEIQGNAIATVLQGLPLRSPGGALVALIVVVLAALAPLASLRSGPRRAAGLAGLVGLMYLGAAYLLFAAGTITPVVHPLAALTLGALGVLMIGREHQARPALEDVAAAPARDQLVPRASASVASSGASVAPLSGQRVLAREKELSGRPPVQPLPREELRAGDEIAGFRLERLVGRGGMGVVYRAEQIELGRKAAVKIIAPELAADPIFRARFSREARSAATIDHPNIVTVYAAGEEDGLLYLAMRLVDGEDLAVRLRRDGRLSPQVTVEIVAQIASALDAAHDTGLIHRDVKPANVLLTTHDDAPVDAYLTDFGVSRDLEATRATATGAFVGSVDYVAPEQIRDARASVASDVYSLGCVAFECLTGVAPFHRDTGLATIWAHVSDPPPRASEHVEGLSPGADGAITRALAKKPDERWLRCSAFADALREAL